MIGRMLFALLILAVTGAVAHSAALATWHGMGLYAAPVFSDPVAPRRVAAVPVAVDLAPVHALAPFGTRIAPPPQAPVSTVPQTPLATGLALRGVMVASRQDRSVAIITAPGIRATRYAIGEKVTDRATLAEVRPDRVILSDGPRRETLWLDEKDAPAPPAGSGTAFASTTGTAGGTAPPARSPVNSTAAPRRTTPAGPAGARGVDEIIDLYRRRIAVNPMAVLNGFGVSPTAEGYRIGPAPSEGVVRAGLKTGDIIAEVNGEAVGTVEKDRRLFEQVVASGFARVKIIRNGQEIVLSFPFR